MKKSVLENERRMKKALIVTTDRYPNGDAGAVRTHAFAKLLQMLGYQPTVVGMGESTDFKFRKEDGVIYTSFRLSSSDIVSRIKGRLQFCKRVKSTLLHKDTSWDIILVGLVSRETMNALKTYAEKNNIPLLHDSVEWYSPEQFSIGKLHPAYIAMDRRNRVYVDQSMRVIAISSYLEKHFQSRGILTVRIPAVMNVEQMSCEKIIDPHKLVFTYAGSPGKKDYLRVIIESFSEMPTAVPYELRLIGITKEQLVTLCDVDPAHIEKLGAQLCCMGRIPRAQVLEELKRSDFTVLIRSEEQRYAKAGFPTKFAESLATATPVISNATSDIANYLQDGVNGYLVSACSPQALTESLQKAFALSYEERIVMQKTARKTAEDHFDYTRYVDYLKRILDNKKTENHL